MSVETKNAVIKSAVIEIEDHGCLTAWLYLDYGGSGQGFGGHMLSHTGTALNYDSPNVAGVFITRCLEIGGVEKWSQLPGKTIRVKGDMQSIIEVGHIIKDDWFNPKEEFQNAS